MSAVVDIAGRLHNVVAVTTVHRGENDGLVSVVVEPRLRRPTDPWRYEAMVLAEDVRIHPVDVLAATDAANWAADKDEQYNR